MKERFSIITLKDSDPEQKIPNIDQFIRRKKELVGMGAAAFRAGDNKTLLVSRRPLPVVPDLCLRDNSPVVVKDTGKRIYTYTDVRFDEQRQEVDLKQGAIVVLESGWSTIMPQEKTDVHTAYEEEFSNTLFGYGRTQLEEIMEIFHSISPENKIDEYGRTEQEAKKDKKINAKIQDAAENLLMHSELYDMAEITPGQEIIALGQSADDKRLVVRGYVNKQDNSIRELHFQIDNTYDDFPPGIFSLNKREKRLRYQKAQILSRQDGDESGVIYPRDITFDSLASEDQAKDLLQRLQTSILRL